ncbi:hypothetical protein GE21DRAFT_3712 [Neurospora crassa]|uniref:Uncharacterized protein n=1 Tax=Neurospora crassa (strain ATCC 24698 / 74-OR23-1A / CBS 708.71 / DSM 1257 / FGSC 987) TaxID=367110 RepID=Q7S195_NEUCR|nr:hypothetical protein NCU09766 [Neurospora crassa OR74A]EAA29114.2 hypothetical protein NCU09766 [Neurospora crassa OR74A]KHE79046.1 hypothetical protein GE21DRAFT_3712 [Neurospora crassa]|eukprot:XP_958350.2 hypothetical protein NCU09766 [Neurospora crassa OR74A]
MAQPAMYECIHHGPTSLDKKKHLSHLEDDRASPRLFVCGRCGYTTKIYQVHLKHLRRLYQCLQMKEPKMYECRTHGPTSLTMEEHIAHLRDSSLHQWVQYDE